jgi:site-specific recombinase XerD
MVMIVTIRYNNETWQSNKNYREKKELACIYASPCKITENIDLNSPVFVIEMNNSVNEIIGIGLIKNKLADKVYKVQENSNYNRYIYIGDYHISRDIIDDYNPELVSILDEILFKGYTHSKRGSGLTKIPEKALKLEICKDVNIKDEIKKIFVYHFREKIETKKKKIQSVTL